MFQSEQVAHAGSPVSSLRDFVAYYLTASSKAFLEYLARNRLIFKSSGQRPALQKTSGNKNFQRLFGICLDEALSHTNGYLYMMESHKKGGLLIAGNLYSHLIPLKPFVEKLTSQREWKTYEINIGTGLLIVRES